MFIRILKLLPIIIPILIKLFDSLAGVRRDDLITTQAQEEAVNRAMKEVEEDIKRMIGETVEKYRPKVEKAAKSLPSEEYTERQKRIEELEKEFLEKMNSSG